MAIHVESYISYGLLLVITVLKHIKHVLNMAHYTELQSTDNVLNQNILHTILLYSCNYWYIVIV